MTGKSLSSRDLSRLFPSTRYCAHHGGVALIEGGKWLASGAYFTQNLDWTDQQWQDARARIKARNDEDKAQRSV